MSAPALMLMGEVDDHLQAMQHYAHSRAQREAMGAVQQLLAQAQCVVSACEADDVAALVREVNVLRAAVAKALGSAS